MNLDTDLIPLIKINSKWITDLNVEQRTIKLSENNVGHKLDDLGYGKDFLDVTPRHDPQKKELINWTSLN